MEGQNSGGDTRTKRRGRSDSATSQLDCKRVRVDSAYPVSGAEILDILDGEIDIGLEIQGLDSVIRSLEETLNPPAPAPENQIDDDQLDLGYLLEATDDELGLPPTVSGTEIDSSADGILRLGDMSEHKIAGGESNAEGLFECGGYDDVPELQWCPESMPAL